MKADEDDSKIRNLISETYATQRMDVIDRKKSTIEFLLMCPHLEDAQHFLAHASVLFRGDVNQMWDDTISSKVRPRFLSSIKNDRGAMQHVNKQKAARSLEERSSDCNQF